MLGTKSTLQIEGFAIANYAQFFFEKIHNMNFDGP
jgi:hypothetical protein